MTLDQLRGFCAVAQEESFSRAAKRLYVTQPAISMQVKALEQGLGEVLFDRTGKQPRLTEAGAILYAHATQILESLESAKHEIHELHGVVQGHLTIGCSDTISTYLLPPVLSHFVTTFPGVELTIHNKTSFEVAQMVRERTVDVGLATMPVGEEGLTEELLFECSDRAVCATTHPLAQATECRLDQLNQHRLLVLEQGSKSRQILDQVFREAGCTVANQMELGSIEVLKAFAQNGLGVAIVPAFAVRAEVESETLAEVVVQGLAKRRIGVVVHQSRPLSPAARAFLDQLRAGVGKFSWDEDGSGTR